MGNRCVHQKWWDIKPSQQCPQSSATTSSSASKEEAFVEWSWSQRPAREGESLFTTSYYSTAADERPHSKRRYFSPHRILTFWCAPFHHSSNSLFTYENMIWILIKWNLFLKGWKLGKVLLLLLDKFCIQGDARVKSRRCGSSSNYMSHKSTLNQVGILKIIYVGI